MSLVIEVPEDIAELLRSRAAERGEDVNQFAVSTLRNSLGKRSYTARELLAMPYEKQQEILRRQAERIAPLYEADLALPPSERELVAFTALDGVDPIREPKEYLRADTN
jgi:hypothetical protein